MAEASSADGRGVTPLQGAFFRGLLVLPANPCVFGGDIYYRGSGIPWCGWPFKLTK